MRSIARLIALMMAGWSSRTRMLYMTVASGSGSDRGKRLLHGKDDLEQRALGHRRAHRDVAAVLPDDAQGDGPAEAGAAADPLGGEEGFENAAEDVFVDPAPVVADVDLHPIGVELAGADFDAPVRAHRLRRVDQDVHEDLAQLGRIALDQRQCIEMGGEAEMLAGQAPHQVEGRGDRAMYVEQLEG